MRRSRVHGASKMRRRLHEETMRRRREAGADCDAHEDPLCLRGVLTPAESRRRTELHLRKLCPEIEQALTEMRAAYDVELMLRHEPLMWPSTAMSGTKTGRISSSQPNLGNYPRPFDYSQLELRTLAQIRATDDAVDALSWSMFHTHVETKRGAKP